MQARWAHRGRFKKSLSPAYEKKEDELNEDKLNEEELNEEESEFN